MFFFKQKLNIQENILLSNYTTFRIGGPARYFCEVKSKEELVEAVKWAKKNNLIFFVFGGGSNLLVFDEGFEGLIIKVKSEKLKVYPEEVRRVENYDEKVKIIEAEAGVPLLKVILETTKNGYSGLEWEFGIPGTVGGAIFGNAGRLGQDISQVVEKVKVLDSSSLEEREFNFKDCDFKYRESRFKKSGLIILSAVLHFKKAKKEEIGKILAQAKEIVKNSPPWPSAGCIFKNYQVKGEDDVLLKNHPELVPKVRGGKIGVGFLIGQCGLAGRQIGGAQIWEGHANYIVNLGGAKAKDVLELMKIIREAVKEKFSVELDEEIRRLNCKF